MRHLVRLVAVTAFLLVVHPLGASAADLTLPVDTIIYAEPGSVVELGRVPVRTDIAGPLCTWEATVTNQDSAHPQNDIIVSSGDSTLVLADVEATAERTTSNSGSAYLVDEVVVSLRMGPDGVFSGGMELTIVYTKCQPVPTTTAPTTTTTMPTTTSMVETTTSTTVEQQPEPLGPSVTTSTTAPTSTTGPLGPQALPVTGNRPWQPYVGAGIALLAVGSLLIVMTRFGRAPTDSRR